MCDKYQWYNYAKEIKECTCYQNDRYCEKNIPVTTFKQTLAGKQQTTYSPTAKLTSSSALVQYIPSTLASVIKGSGAISSEGAKYIRVTVRGVGLGGILCGILLTVLVYKIRKRTPWKRKGKQGVSNAMHGVAQANEQLIYSEINEQDNIPTESCAEPSSLLKTATSPIDKFSSQDNFYNHLNENDPDEKIDNYQHTKEISNPPHSLVTEQQCCSPENVHHHLNENQPNDNMIHDNHVYEETDKQVFLSKPTVEEKGSTVEEETIEVPEKEENSYFVLESYKSNEKQ